MKSSPSSSLPSDKPFEKLNCQPHFRPRLVPHFLSSWVITPPPRHLVWSRLEGAALHVVLISTPEAFLWLNLKPGWTSGNRSVKDCHERYSTGKCVRNAPWESLSVSPPSCTRSSKKTYFEYNSPPPFLAKLPPPKKKREKKERKKWKWWEARSREVQEGKHDVREKHSPPSYTPPAPALRFCFWFNMERLFFILFQQYAAWLYWIMVILWAKVLGAAVKCSGD